MGPSQSQDTQHVVDPEPPREKDWALVCSAFIARFIMAWMLKWILSFLIKAFLRVSVPGWGTYIVCLACMFQLKDPPMRQPKSAPGCDLSDIIQPKSAPGCDHQEIGDWMSQVKKVLDNIEKAIQEHGAWIEESGTVFRDTFMSIHKRQKEQLRQYKEFKKQHADEFGAIVTVLEGHRKQMAEKSRAATEENTSLCNIIGQYRATVEENQKIVLGHMDSVLSTFDDQRKLAKDTQTLAENRDDYIKNSLDNHEKLIEENKRLVREQSTSIDKVVCDHASLVAEYQNALDSMAMLIMANHLFTLIHKTSDWKSFGDDTGRLVAEKDLAEEAEQRAAESRPVLASADVIQNLQQMTRAFRDTSAAMDAVREDAEGPGQVDGFHTQRNHAKYADGHDKTIDTSSGLDQLMATAFSQLRDTLQSTVEARHAEEMRQIRQGQEDMEKLRADLKDIQRFRKAVCEGYELQDELNEMRRETKKARLEQERREEEAVRRKQREEEVRRLVREEMDRRAAEEKANATSAPTPTASTGLTATTDDDTVTAVTTTDPTDVAYPEPISAATSTDDDDEDGGALYYYSDDDAEAMDSVNGVDRLMGDFLGRMLAREDWPDKKKTRRKSRKAYAMAKQRAEQQSRE